MYFWYNADFYLDVFRECDFTCILKFQKKYSACTHVVVVTTAKFHYFIKGGINLKPLNNLGDISIMSTDKMFILKKMGEESRICLKDKLN